VIVSAKVIENTQKPRECWFCVKTIYIGYPCVRIYGCGVEGDPKYVIYGHIKCNFIIEPDKKIRKVVDEYFKGIGRCLSQLR